MTYDVAYDLWLNRSATKRPCRTNGTLEVMVWTDYDQRALLPGSMEIAPASIPFVTHGVVNVGKQAWSVFTSNVFPGGRTAPWGGTIWLVLNPAEVVNTGTVSVDLSSSSPPWARSSRTAMVGVISAEATGWTQSLSGWNSGRKVEP